jgi:hypothetical protein
MTAFLIVKAEVLSASDRQAFDTWYATEHLPDAKSTFGALRAWRGWSDVEPLMHYAFYEFPDLGAVQAATSSAGIAELIAEFDRTWTGRVTRFRDRVEQIQVLAD